LRPSTPKTLPLKMRALDLFAGTHSFTRVAQQAGYEVTSVDISPKHSPTIVANVLDWDYKQYPRGHWDFIWCSPPCTLLSIAPAHLFTAEQREERAGASLAVLEKMVEILDWFNPRWYVIENPNSSALWRQPIMQGLPTVVVSYCMYGFPYRKNTKLATNIGLEPKRCRGDCGFVRQVRDGQGKIRFHHLEVAKQGVSAHCRGLGVQSNTHKQDELYRVPEQLVRDILEAAM